METINKQYIVDEQNKKIAVQIPIRVFERIEEVLENYALVQLMKENEHEEILAWTRQRHIITVYKYFSKTNCEA
jgi:RelB antitoxin of RelBE toxin-antitoxin system